MCKCDGRAAEAVLGSMDGSTPESSHYLTDEEKSDLFYGESEIVTYVTGTTANSEWIRVLNTAQQSGQSTTKELIDAEYERLRVRSQEKNLSYNDSALHPIRIFSKLGPDEGMRVRLDDKLSRLTSDNWDAFDENPIDDLVGYLILLRIQMRKDTGK